MPPSGSCGGGGADTAAAAFFLTGVAGMAYPGVALSDDALLASPPLVIFFGNVRLELGGRGSSFLATAADVEATLLLAGLRDLLPIAVPDAGAATLRRRFCCCCCCMWSRSTSSRRRSSQALSLTPLGAPNVASKRCCSSGTDSWCSGIAEVATAAADVSADAADAAAVPAVASGSDNGVLSCDSSSTSLTDAFDERGLPPRCCFSSSSQRAGWC